MAYNAQELHQYRKSNGLKTEGDLIPDRCLAYIYLAGELQNLGLEGKRIQGERALSASLDSAQCKPAKRAALYRSNKHDSEQARFE